MPTEPASRRYMRHQSIWLADDGWSVEVVDQARLPAEWVTRRLCSPGDVLSAMSGEACRDRG
ncbi:hypothetical protein [Niveispirillum fermenti]|uniref:hypothetical protein n=1 Tax=Niveispirillum fermenti TaxID=1233113 RepID=UPI004041262D